MLEWITAGASALAVIGTGLIGVWSTRQDQARQRVEARLDENDRTTRTQGQEIATLRENVRNLPTADSIGRVHEKLNEIGLQVAEMKGALLENKQQRGRMTRK